MVPLTDRETSGAPAYGCIKTSATTEEKLTGQLVAPVSSKINYNLPRVNIALILSFFREPLDVPQDLIFFSRIHPGSHPIPVGWYDNLLAFVSNEIPRILCNTTDCTRIRRVIDTLPLSAKDARGEQVPVRQTDSLFLCISHFMERLCRMEKHERQTPFIINFDCSKLHFHPSKWDGSNFDHIDIWPFEPHLLKISRTLREKKDVPRILVKALDSLGSFRSNEEEDISQYSSEISLGIVLALKRHSHHEILIEKACYAICNLARYRVYWDDILKFGGIQTVYYSMQAGIGGMDLQTKFLLLLRDFWDPRQSSPLVMVLVSGFTSLCMEEHPDSELIQELGVGTLRKLLDPKLPLIQRGEITVHSYTLCLHVTLTAMNGFGCNGPIQCDGCLAIMLLVGGQYVSIEAAVSAGMAECILCSMTGKHSSSIGIISGLGALRTLLPHPNIGKTCFTAILSIMNQYTNSEIIQTTAATVLRSFYMTSDIGLAWLTKEPGIVGIFVTAMQRHAGCQEIQLDGCWFLKTCSQLIKQQSLDVNLVVIVDTVFAAMKHLALMEEACNAIYTMSLSWSGVKSILLTHVSQIASATEALETRSDLENERSLIAALRLLCHLDLRAEGVQAAFVGAHMIISILNFMIKWPLNEDIQLYGCKIVGCFVRSHHVHKDCDYWALSRYGAKDVARAALSKFPYNHSIVYSGAEIILRIREFEKEQYLLSNSLAGID